MPYVRSLYHLRSEGYQTQIGRQVINVDGSTFQTRTFCTHIAAFCFLFELQVKKLKYLFLQRRGLITVEYHKKNKGSLL
jgi:hypothetical protein